MKTRTWIILLAAVFLAALAACIPLLFSAPAATARITSGGEYVATVDLGTPREFTVESPTGGSNTITVRDGAIAVTAADCPDHYCMHRGFCTGGSPIVCLPNQLTITFLDGSDVDLVAG